MEMNLLARDRRKTGNDQDKSRARSCVPLGGRAAAVAVVLALVLAASIGGFAAAPASAASLTNWYFAEGYTGGGFQEYICIANPGATAATVSGDFLFNGGGSVSRSFTINARSRFTVDVNSVVGAGKEVSAVMTSDHPDLAMERPIYFNYSGGLVGSHCVTAAPTLSRTWYFAEGYTGPGFDEYVCVLNPNPSAASLTFKFQTVTGQEVRGGEVPAMSRATFKVNDLLGADRESSLALSSSQPVVAERPMYFSYTSSWGATLTGGHCVMGATGLSRSLYFAEGTTRAGFDEWLTLQNPGRSAITVSATYQMGTGQGAPVTRAYQVGALQRRTVPVALEVGRGKDVSVLLSSSAPFLAERPMYYGFSHSGLDFQGASCALGSPAASTDKYFAEGYTGQFFEQWLCLQNTSTSDAAVEITYMTQERGSLGAKTITIGAGQRVTVFVNDDAGPNLQVSTRVRVVKGTGVMSESSIYFDKTRWPMPCSSGAQSAKTVPVPAGSLYGLCFSPYLLQDPSQGVVATSVSSLITGVAKYSGWIRTFGSEGEWGEMPAQARSAGMHVAGGCDIYTDLGRNASEVAALTAQARSRQIDMAVVGDEVLLGNVLPEDQLISYINQVKAAGIATGTSDSWDEWLSHPRLMAACDVILINVYPYWEGCSVETAVGRVADYYRQVKAAAGNKTVIIETGWPTGGEVRESAVPGAANAARFLSEFMWWADSSAVPYFYFEAYDELWKASREGACGRYWGLWDENARLKPEIAAVLKPR